MKAEKINAVITGGASGLGEATVRKIIDLGGTVSWRECLWYCCTAA